MSRYEHTDDVHNSGVVWGRVSQVHPALLQHMDVIVSVATEWNNNQLPIPTTRKIVGTQCCVTLGYGVRHLPGWEPIHSCVWTLFFFSVNRTVKSLIGEVFQLLELTPSTCERYVLKLCDSEEYLQRSVPDLTSVYSCSALRPANVSRVSSSVRKCWAHTTPFRGTTSTSWPCLYDCSPSTASNTAWPGT